MFATTSLLARYTTPLSRANVVQTSFLCRAFYFFRCRAVRFSPIVRSRRDSIVIFLEAGRTIYVSLRNSIYRSCNFCIRFLILIPKMDRVFCIKCINRCHESLNRLPFYLLLLLLLLIIFKVRFSNVVYIVLFSVSLSIFTNCSLST